MRRLRKPNEVSKNFFESIKKKSIDSRSLQILHLCHPERSIRLQHLLSSHDQQPHQPTPAPSTVPPLHQRRRLFPIHRNDRMLRELGSPGENDSDRDVRRLGERRRRAELSSEESWREERHADVDDLEVGFDEIVGESVKSREKRRGRGGAWSAHLLSDPKGGEGRNQTNSSL